MNAILLVAGEGTRLRPLTRSLPKCLLPINGRPLLAYWLRDLVAAGIERILVNTHYHADLVSGWLAQSRYASRVTISHEEQLLGTGGTLLANADFAADEPLLLIHGDNLCRIDWDAFIDAHLKRPADTHLTMLTFNTPAPHTCGIVEPDRRGVVQAFYEKVAHPPGNLANGAIYIIESEILSFLRELDQTIIDFSTQVLPYFVGGIATFHNQRYHCDIGHLDQYLSAQLEFDGTPPPPGTEDAWGKLMSAENGRKTTRFRDNLIEALEAEIIPWPDGIPNAKVRPKTNFEGNIVLHVSDPKPDFKEIRHHVSDLTSGAGQLWLFLDRVRAGFTARVIAQHYQLKSLAAVAGPN